jgi:hypothetical protein
MVLGDNRADLNSLIILGVWTIWKHWNACVFKGGCPNVVVALNLAKVEAQLWGMAGAKGLS